jgi:LysM repeat protein
MVGHDAKGGFMFVPWARSGEHVPTPTLTRDAASTANTIKGRADQQLTLAKVVGAMSEVDRRLSALEAKRSLIAQQQEQFARAMTAQQQPTEQPTPAQSTQDHACACQHQPAPQAPYRDGVNQMSPRHPGLAPMPFVRSGAFPKFDPPRGVTRDQQNFGEKPPSRFTSAEADRMARALPRGSAGPVGTQAAVNDIALRSLRDKGANVSGPPGHMAEASDPAQRNIGSGPFDQYSSDVTRPSAAALSELNSQFNKAKTQSQKDSITDAWKRYVSGSRDDGSQWKPRQAEVHDAPAWQGLYSANKETIGGDPNKIQVGQSLNLPGGGTHTVEKGETLSGIAGGDLGSKPLLGGGGEPSGGNYSAGGDLKTGEGMPNYSSNNSLKVSEGNGVPGNKLPTTLMGGGGEPSGGNYSSGGDLKVGEGWPSGGGSYGAVPTPPSRPSGFGGSAEASEASPSSSSSSGAPLPPTKLSEYGGTGSGPAPEGTPTPPSRPYSLGGGSQGPGGGGGNNATNPGEASTESFLRSQGIPKGSNDAKPRGRR